MPDHPNLDHYRAYQDIREEADNGTEALCKVLYNRPSQPSDYDHFGASNKTLWDAAEEIARLRIAIQRHRDAKGDDRCWMDDEELYKTLPEGYTPPERDTAVELDNCKKFIACRQNPATEYVSPEREIEILRARIAELENGK